MAVNEILLYIGSILPIIWGIAHLPPTKSVVKGFGELSRDNKLTLVMEWIAEGLLLIFAGVLILFVTIFGDPKGQIEQMVIWITAGMFVILAIISLFTGARTSVIPMKLCPAIFLSATTFLLLGSLL